MLLNNHGASEATSSNQSENSIRVYKCMRVFVFGKRGRGISLWSSAWILTKRERRKAGEAMERLSCRRTNSTVRKRVHYLKPTLDRERQTDMYNRAKADVMGAYSRYTNLKHWSWDGRHVQNQNDQTFTSNVPYLDGLLIGMSFDPIISFTLSLIDTAVIQCNIKLLIIWRDKLKTSVMLVQNDWQKF